MIRTLHPGASARNGRGSSLGAVTEALCDQIRCGILQQHEVGLNALWECSQAGFVGALACTHPVCAPYGGCTAILQRLQSGQIQQPTQMPAEPIIDLPGYTPAPEPTFTQPEPIWYPPETPDLETPAPAPPPPPSVPMVYQPPPEEIEPEFTAPEATTQPPITTTGAREETTGRRVVGLPGIDPGNPFYGLLTKVGELEKHLPAWAQGWPWYYWAALIVAAYYAARITTRKRRRKRRR